MNHFINNALEWERKDTMKKSEITKNLKQIKKLLEEDSPMIAKERINFLINDITKKELILNIKVEAEHK